MKKIFSSLNIQKIWDNIIQTIQRFPTSTSIIILISLCFFTLLHKELSDISAQNIVKAVLSLILTFFFSIGIDLNNESRKITWIKKYLLQLIAIGFGILFFFSFNSNMDSFENIIFFLLSMFGIIWFLFFAPYLKNIISNNGKQSVYYAYFYKIATLVLISYILGWVLFAWWAIAITTIETLFWLGSIIDGKIYGDWAIISLSIFTPLFTLNKIPSSSDFTKDSLTENAFFSILIKYVAVPFVMIYFIILYAYSIKVLLSFWDWPKWEVSWMVIGFSILGYMTYIFSYIFEAKHTLIKQFRKYFPYAVVPQVCMLFYAIYLRINQYDLTMNRYFIVIFGTWLLILSLYFIFSKRKYLWNIPALLTVFTIIISIGPWSVYNLPESRQLDRLENNLIQAGILKDSNIYPLENYNDIDSRLSWEIYDGIDYLCDFNNCETIKNIFSEQYSIIEAQDKKEFEEQKAKDIKKYQDDPDTYSYLSESEDDIYRGMSHWEIVSEISEYIKVQKHYDNGYINPTIYLSTKYNNHFPIDTSGWNSMMIMTNHSNNEAKNYAKIDIQEKTLQIIQNWTIKETIQIDSIIYTLKEYNHWSSLDTDKMTFEVSWEKYQTKIFFNNISFPNPQHQADSNQSRYYENVDGYVLIK